MSSALSKRKPYWPPRVQRCRRSFNSPMMFVKFETVRWVGSSMYIRSMASHRRRSSLKSSRYRCPLPSISTRKKLNRNCRFSFVCGSENGLIVKSRDSWPAFRYEPPKIVVSDSKLPPISKMKVSGAYFCAFCSRKLQKYDFPLPVMPRISVCATSPLCRFRK